MKSFSTILDDAVLAVGDKQLFIFPQTRWNEADSLTYGQLADRVSQAAGCFAESTQRADRAVILFSTGVPFWEALFGCFAAGVIAVPLKIPNLRRASHDFLRVIADCSPTLGIADASFVRQVRENGDQFEPLRTMKWTTPEDWRSRTGTGSIRVRAPSEIALLQYTSGSTSSPKGVQVSHANLLANVELIRQRMEIRTAEDRSVTWLPHYHDMGLVGSYLVTLYTRNTSWCLPPEEFAWQPARWLSLISEHRATICGGPDFAYRTCAERITDIQLEGVQLSSWRVAFNGAERVRPATMQSFTHRFSRWGFRSQAFFPCYGLSEGTLLVTGGPANEGPKVLTVSESALQLNQIVAAKSASDGYDIAASGQTCRSSPVVVVDPTSGKLVEERTIGQIFVSGPSVSPGYFGRRDLDQHSFVDIPFEGQTQRFLKTGDLGFVSEGHLFVTGRLSEMMIVRGRNLYPEDVERVASQGQASLVSNGVAAFSVEADGQESLVIVAELQRSEIRSLHARRATDDNCDAAMPARSASEENSTGENDLESILNGIRQQVTEALGVSPMDVVLVPPAAIPRTTSGKLRRLALRTQYLSVTGLPVLASIRARPGP